MSWVTVASLTEVPAGEGMKIDVGEHRIALFRVDDHVYAIGDRCSHAEASLSEGDVFDDEVECPRHGAVFDLATGAAKSLPATAPVPTYAVKTQDGAVMLEIHES